MIKLENITCSYKEPIIEDISLEIDKKKITFIVGVNGSGKSTLGHVLAGIKEIDKGHIFIDNEEINKKINITKMREKVGIVFQDPTNQLLFNRVYDNINFSLENMKVPKEKRDNIIKKALKEVEMLDYIYSNPYNLSLGQKQKIVIASIIAVNPKYIIFDESTSMLDINGRKNIYNLINKLKIKGLGIIFITNIMDELIYGDEVIIINNKKITKYKKEELFNNLDILTKNNLDLSFILRLIKELKGKNKEITNYSEEDILKVIME